MSIFDSAAANDFVTKLHKLNRVIIHLSAVNSFVVELKTLSDFQDPSFALFANGQCKTQTAVTKSGTGTWGCGDMRTRGRGDSGTWGRGDSGTRGLGDV